MSINVSPVSRAAPTRLSRLLMGVIAGVVLILALSGAVWLGYGAGSAQRAGYARATQAADLKHQYDLGVADLAAGRYEMANTRFEYILKIDPNYPGAEAQRAEVLAALQATDTPTPPPTLTPLPGGPNPAAVFAQAQQSFSANNWEATLEKLIELRALDPGYETAKVDGMFFAALRNRGVARIQGKELEAGIFDLTQAEAFGALDDEAASHRTWARYYLAAQGYWGLDWKETARILRELHGFAPYFHDTQKKLYQATLNYAAVLAAAGDACGAAEQYAFAQTLTADAGVAEKLAAAQTNCQLTPTPASGDGLTPTPTPGN